MMKYIFLIIAVVIQPLVSFWVYRKQDKEKASLRVPLVFYSGVYLVVQFYVFWKFLRFISREMEIYAYLIQGVILALFIIVELAFLASNKHIERIEQQDKERTEKFRDIREELLIQKTFLDNSKLELLKPIEEAIRYADPTSDEKTQREDDEILHMLSQLNGIDNNDEFEKQCNRIYQLLEIRKIKNTKGKR